MPGNAASNDIENPVENLAFGIGSGSTAGFCLRKKWLKNLPLLIIEVSGIGFSCLHPASLSQETNPIPDFFDTLLVGNRSCNPIPMGTLSVWPSTKIDRS